MIDWICGYKTYLQRGEPTVLLESHCQSHKTDNPNSIPAPPLLAVGLGGVSPPLHASVSSVGKQGNDGTYITEL
jgi:hypothetical protein